MHAGPPLPEWFLRAFPSGHLNVLNTKLWQSKKSIEVMCDHFKKHLVEQDECGNFRKDAHGTYIFKDYEHHKDLYRTAGYKNMHLEVSARGRSYSPGPRRNSPELTQREKKFTRRENKFTWPEKKFTQPWRERVGCVASPPHGGFGLVLAAISAFAKGSARRVRRPLLRSPQALRSVGCIIPRRGLCQLRCDPDSLTGPDRAGGTTRLSCLADQAVQLRAEQRGDAAGAG
eukprot:1183235-Prorocentrum_minimum.AAC.1